MTSLSKGGINIDKPRYDQSTYIGRAKHFFTVTNPLNLFASTSELDKAKDIVTRYRSGESIGNISEEQLWKYKALYDSAHHPETGERQLIFGRMSAQVPMNMIISGCLLTFYKTLGWSYLGATTGAVGTALGLNRLVTVMPPLIGRFVPFCAVAAANCINIPMMRSRELREGIELVDEDGNHLANSQKVAKIAISQVVFSRIVMCAPGKLLPPFIMNHLEKKGILRRYPWISLPLQVTVCGLFLVFTTPLCCALFPQKSSIPVRDLEPDVQEGILKRSENPPTIVYYNKGL